MLIGASAAPSWTLGHARAYHLTMLVWEDVYMRLEIDRQQRMVKQTRTSRPYDDAQVLHFSAKSLVEEMQVIKRAEYALLQDMRAVRGRNDPDFEAAIKVELAAMSGGFRKLAVLVLTQVGRLQVQRNLQHASVSMTTARAFLDEQEALRWLSEP